MELLLLILVLGKAAIELIFTFQYGATATRNIDFTPISHWLFTFQYGATATLIISEIERELNRFTFQYGATAT